VETHKPDRAIVVGYDGSLHSRLALRWAVDEAARIRSAVQIVSVLGWLVEAAGAITTASEAQACEQARQLLDQAAADAYAQDPDVPVSTALEVGHPASVLCDASADARLLVMGSRGLGGFTGLLAGSVSVAVATHAHCPVVVVRHLLEVASRLPVVVGVDDSAQSQQAVRFAFAEADQRGLGVVAVRAWKSPLPDPYTAGYLRSEEAAEIQTSERRFLQQAIGPATKEYPLVPTQSRLVFGDAGVALAEASEGAQLVVVGSRGHGGFAGLLLGSVGLHLLHCAACPVVIIREPASDAKDDPS